MSRTSPARRTLRPATDPALTATAGVLGALRVPDESDTAGTVGLEVTLPADHPLSSVRTTPVPGWTATTTKAAVDAAPESAGGVLHGRRTCVPAPVDTTPERERIGAVR